MEKLGILQLIDSLNTGGAEVLAVNIANSLQDKNINSHLCATRLEGKLKENINKDIGYVFLDRKSVIDIKSIFRLKKYIKKHKISIIHAHATSYFFAFSMKLIYPKVKIIWHDHFGLSQDLSKRRLFPLKQISYFFKAIISVNFQLKKWSEVNLYCKEVLFINNFAEFHMVKPKTVLKGDKSKRIVHLAAFREQKDHITLINAFELFLERNGDWTLHLIGELKDDFYSKKVLDLVEEKSLQKNVFFYGACLDISNILQQVTIGVLSSKSEGLPLSLLEYGLAKLPVIVTNVGECAKVVYNNKSGFVVDSGDFLSFSEKLNELVNSDTMKNRFKENFNKTIINKYSKEAFMNTVLKLYYKF
ncbi:MAG: glycosyltransferase [Polaribacter sp.]